ncbi:hypothetical protein Pyn_36024 [Prunus yedoensis var. nudiflora]|uniref:Transmembrane protein n=1 Tax=Prunus yedoensis var. nudiflora TaxID=2094558 RepID=A0A314ZIX0_PRUYE|nr:hypothetical protein Pyn_36024 [Prunus yedoensis var. nudiflora]
MELGSESMEMESNLTVKKNQKLETFDILRKALIISARNINFFIFTILTSLPLFFFLVYYEIFLQNFLVEIFEIVKQSLGYDYFYRVWPNVDITRKLNKEFLDELIQLCLLYLVPLHLLELSTVLVIVDLASKIYTEEGPVMSLKEMVNKPFDKARLKGTFITSVYVLFLSTCILLGLISLVTTYFVVLRNFGCDVFFAALCLPAFVGLLALYLALSAVWNMSLVISMLDGVHGTGALALAIYYSRGSEWCGLRLMLISLFYLGNVLKWVVCVVYFYDCKNRAFKKKECVESVDDEVGTQVEAVEE